MPLKAKTYKQKIPGPAPYCKNYTQFKLFTGTKNLLLDLYFKVVSYSVINN